MLRRSIAQTRQSLDIFATLPLGHPKLIDLLQVQPELGARTEEVPQAQRRIPGDRTLTVEDMRDPIRGNLELTCQLCCAHLECLKLLGEVLAGMNCVTRHNTLLSV